MFFAFVQDPVLYSIFHQTHRRMGRFEAVKTVVTISEGFCRWIKHSGQASKSKKKQKKLHSWLDKYHTEISEQ